VRRSCQNRRSIHGDYYDKLFRHKNKYSRSVINDGGNCTGNLDSGLGLEFLIRLAGKFVADKTAGCSLRITYELLSLSMININCTSVSEQKIAGNHKKDS
jgi:hypothetical protein